ncbi:TOBE domain-containing protein [Sulfurimonas sp. C5]|uniref:TOBE domain-containing protein n=1 Tax=Sulfurimonas sp. C5 TaxID=3036947 RepID=UPI002457E033|nr:TOBE domain-containing protein [Sulfurimonas sp. C5]MDH4945326.1 TOBE domain-containing protein [Sulfurimonas sp. C5]
MKLSARNQLHGIVEYLDKGMINSSVYIKLKSGYTLVSVITNTAVEDLNLQIGDKVLAFFKSSSTLITTDITLNISARNKFQGTISNINEGTVTAEIEIEIGASDKIVSVITKISTRTLELHCGDAVSAIIKATDVMLAK